MRAIIRDLSEMTDSREIMEAKTHPAITVFITIVLMLLGAGLIWSFIGEIDDVAKASGIVRSNEKVSNIQTTVLGTVESLNIEEGQWVEAGELLMRLEHESLQLQLSSKEEELEKIKEEIEYLKQYRDSIEQHKNLFSQGTESESFYYHLTEQYLLEYSQKELDYNSSIKNLEQAKEETSFSKKGISLNQRSVGQKNDQAIADYTRQIEELEEELQLENLLKHSLEQEKNQLPEHDTLRTEQFNQYMLSLEKFNSTISEAEKKVNKSIALGERFVSKVQLEEEQSQLDLVRLQLIQFKQETVLGVQARINDYKKQLEDSNYQLQQLQQESSSYELQQESFILEEEKLTDQYNNLQQQSKDISQKSEIELKKFKLDRVVQISAAIEEKDKTMQSLLDQMNQLKLSIDKQSIYAPISGKVHMLREINTGDTIQPGEQLLSIIPINESMYKISIAVPNHEIGQLAVGQTVEMNFHAFPKQSFGSLIGTVESISTDSFTQQDGRSYYSVEASITNKPLVNRKGESGELRIGMTAEAYVITDSKKIIHYLLEKINLRD